MLSEYLTLKRKQMKRHQEVRASRKKLVSWHEPYAVCKPYQVADGTTCLNKLRGLPFTFECANFKNCHNANCEHAAKYNDYDVRLWRYNNVCDDLHDFWQKVWDKIEAKCGQTKYWAWEKANKGNVK